MILDWDLRVTLLRSQIRFFLSATLGTTSPSHVIVWKWLWTGCKSIKPTLRQWRLGIIFLFLLVCSCQTITPFMLVCDPSCAEVCSSPCVEVFSVLYGSPSLPPGSFIDSIDVLHWSACVCVTIQLRILHAFPAKQILRQWRRYGLWSNFQEEKMLKRQILPKLLSPLIPPAIMKRDATCRQRPLTTMSNAKIQTCLLDVLLCSLLGILLFL